MHVPTRKVFYQCQICGIEKIFFLIGHLNGVCDTCQTQDTCKTRGVCTLYGSNSVVSFEWHEAEMLPCHLQMENYTQKTKMHKVCLPPKVGVLQKLVLMNLSQDCNLQRLK
jgi:hypothetical protein